MNQNTTGGQACADNSGLRMIRRLPIGDTADCQFALRLVIGRNMEGGNVSVRLHGKGNVGTKS
jgi:hypothetical protein